MEMRLYQVVAEVLGVPISEVSEDTGLGTHTKWDSLRQMNVVLAVEQEFGVRFDDHQLQELTTVGSIRAALERIE